MWCFLTELLWTLKPECVRLLEGSSQVTHTLCDQPGSQVIVKVWSEIRGGATQRGGASQRGVATQICGAPKFLRAVQFYILVIIRAVAIRRSFKIIDLILIASTKRKNTRCGAFHWRESIKHIIRLFFQGCMIYYTHLKFTIKHNCEFTNGMI